MQVLWSQRQAANEMKAKRPVGLVVQVGRIASASRGDWNGDLDNFPTAR
jgi:hypothetical protein